MSYYKNVFLLKCFVIVFHECTYYLVKAFAEQDSVEVVI